MTTLDKICFALSDLEDLDKDCNAALLQYPEDGKVSAIFTHNCIQNAIEMLSQYKCEVAARAGGGCGDQRAGAYAQ